jgi:flavodoxin
MAEHILIVYYSHSGNTEKIAILIQERTDGVLCPVQPETPYHDSFDGLVEQLKEDTRQGRRPRIKTKIDGLARYGTVFIGTPNWGNSVCAPIAAFLSENNMSGKRLAPFCTHGGGGIGNIVRDIALLCPGATILEGFEVSGSDVSSAQAAVSGWLAGLGL